MMYIGDANPWHLLQRVQLHQMSIRQLSKLGAPSIHRRQLGEQKVAQNHCQSNSPKKEVGQVGVSPTVHLGLHGLSQQL